MTIHDLQNLMPLVMLTCGTIVVMLIIAIWRNHALIFAGTLMTLVVALGQLLIYPVSGTQEVAALFTVDGYGQFYMGLVLLATIVVVLLSYDYVEKLQENKEEFYLLLLLGALGAGSLVISSHFISLFLGLETLTVALYVMIAYIRKRERALEAGIKYLILAAFSSAVMLFGMALVYAEVGSMDFTVIGQHLNTAGSLSGLMMAGLGLMITGVGFKLGVVPFHLWTPDVYEGAPAPITAFIATVSKGGMFAVWTRFFMEINVYQY